MLRNFGWRWFPIGLIGAMAVVFAINGYMVYTAVQSFPGEAGTDGFDLSNDYGKVLKAVSRQAALGWTIDAGVDPTAHPQLRLSGPNGAPLPQAVITATVERPVGPDETTHLTFHPEGTVRYVADATLPRGQWDMLLTVSSNGQTVTATRRLMVP